MKLLATIFFALVLTTVDFSQEKEPDIIKVETALVSVPVVVSDRNGRYIPNLTITDFQVFQDGARQEISFFANRNEPLNVALLLDTSLSTQRVIGRIQNAALDFVDQLKPQDRASVVTFDSEVNVAHRPSSDHSSIKHAIRRVDIGYDVGTVMRDAVITTARQVLSGSRGRKAIVILTDGKDFGSYESPSGLINTLQESDVLVYSVFYKTEQLRRRNNRGFRRRNSRRNRRMEQRRKRQDRMNKEAAKYLEAMSDATAGRFFKKQVKDLRKTFRAITAELRNQYRLGYYPTSDSVSGTVHKIKVKVDKKRISVRSRKTYRAK